MKKKGMEKIKSKKEKNIAGKKTISSFFDSILKPTLAAALFLLLANIVSAGDVVVESGKLDVSSNLFVDANGNVGIGTTTPAQKLDVIGQIHSTGDICTDAGGGKCLSSAGVGSSGGGWTDDGTNVRLTASTDKVGIGTATPSNKLHIKDSAANTILVVDSGDGATGRYSALDFYNNGALSWGLGKNPGGNFYIDLGGVGNAMTIDSSRNVGIGTTAPDHKLQIVSGNGNLLRLKNTAGGDFRILSTASGELGIYDEANSAYRLYLKGANVGIGTASPSNLLTIKSNSGQIRMETSTDPANYYTLLQSAYNSNHPFSLTVANNGIAAEYLGVYADGGSNNRVAFPTGKVGIGTTSPVAEFHVKGYQNIESRDGTKDCQIFVVSDGACGGGATSLWSSGGATLCAWCGTA